LVKIHSILPSTDPRLALLFRFPATLFEEDHEDGDVGGVDAADAGGLAEVEGLELVELFAGFEAELVNGEVVEIQRQSQVLGFLHLFDEPLLPGDVTGVTNVVDSLLQDRFAILADQPRTIELEYRVKAMNPAGESLPSNTATVVL